MRDTRSAVRVFELILAVVPAVLNGATGFDPSYAPAAQRPIAELTSISARVTPSGAVHYVFAGFHPAISGVVFSGEGSWNPVTKNASEELIFPQGKLQSQGSCDADPWSEQTRCLKGLASGSNGAPMDLALLPYGLPVGANLLSAQAHLKAKAAYAEGLRNRPTPTPTHTPTPRFRAGRRSQGSGVAFLLTPTPAEQLGRVGTLAGIGRAAAPVAVTPTRTPTPAGSLYGARYQPQLVTTLKVNESVSLSVRVENTSGRLWLIGWPAPSSFALSYRWFQGSTPATPQGLRVPLTAAVPPGATSSPLVVRIQAPAAPGTYTLKWDMLEIVGGGEVLFSSRGVPTFDQTVNVTK
ncbi:MAG: hypothetical protein WCC53_01640 [Thermoanaerobaculia bacterium]|jgi:hypothetical protein